ncbi:MAG: adenine deaminase [Spirochaetaceae bacterium]|nr:adenine deaminase [Spirochaetaceae bacterium]
MEINLNRLVQVAAGDKPADLVIRGAAVACVYSGTFIEGDIAIAEGLIAGIGSYQGEKTIEAKGLYALPGFIDSHIHIESTHLCPEELGTLLVPHGTSTIIADPHEIVNIGGLNALDYMLNAAEFSPLEIFFTLPSCVPATPFENNGAALDACALSGPLLQERVLGLGEFMDFTGVCRAETAALDKIRAAWKAGKIIDGHSPGLSGNALNAYCAMRIHTDHECSTAQAALDRISRGMYVMLRQGSACKDIVNLLPAITPQNERRCLFCSDDRQPKTIFEEGHVDGHMRLAVANGLDPMTAIRMATLNAADCYHLSDRGAIAPGLRADIALVNNPRDFNVCKMFIGGVLAGEDGRCLVPVTRYDDSALRGRFNVRDFSVSKLSLRLKSDDVYVIDVKPGMVETVKGRAVITRNEDGEYLYDAASGIAKLAVVERHKGTGNVGVALIRGFGPRAGALALSVTHDSHNIIAAGANDADMAYAVETLIAMGGGVIAAKDGVTLAAMPLPLGGIMSDQNGEWVEAALARIHHAAEHELGIEAGHDPLITLCFMALPVIPELKLTDKGLFDVQSFSFIPLEAR